jgi:hypothetical protein
MLRVEHSRKHGPFDSRYRPIRRKPTPASLWRLDEERLDWQGFRGRFFPDSRRHVFDALAAYESYLNDVHGRPADGFLASALASSPGAMHNDWLEKTQRSEDSEELPATADTRTLGG